MGKCKAVLDFESVKKITVKKTSRQIKNKKTTQKKVFFFSLFFFGKLF